MGVYLEKIKQLILHVGIENDKEISNLIQRGMLTFLKEPNYIRLDDYSNKPRVFVGDIHGDYEAVEKIVEKWPLDKYMHVLLGDYPDRTKEPLGSLIAVLYITCLKLTHPEDFIVLRGNHESNDIERDDEDIGDILRTLGRRFGNRYGNYLEALEKMFSAMPYAAVSNNGIIALHGGLPNIDHECQLVDISKGIKRMRQSSIAEQILWSDHNIYVNGYCEGPRGYGFVYGEQFFTEKMRILCKNALLRGHEHSLNGQSDFGDRILTLTTSKTYADKCGRLVAIDHNPDKEVKTVNDLEIVNIDG